MGMSMQIELFEALTGAGIKAEGARKVGRQVELAISAGNNTLRSELLDIVATKSDVAELRAATKADMAELKAYLHKAINEQMWKLVLFILAATTLTQGLFKFLS